MTRDFYTIYLLALIIFLSFTDLSYIEKSISTLVAVYILGLFQLVSINDKLDKWK